jgi:hypothetical protein
LARQIFGDSITSAALTKEKFESARKPVLAFARRRDFRQTSHFAQSVAAARSTGLRLLHFSNPERFRGVTLQAPLSLQICNDRQEKNLDNRLKAKQRKTKYENGRALLIAVIGAGLACGVAAQVREQPGEMVQMKSLPASVQQTINQKAAGGEIVRVKREDDANGKWNYEVVVRSQGKEWGF